MTYQTLISAHALSQLMHARDSLLILDCSHDLTNPLAGLQHYQASHLPGAFFVSLDDTLSSAQTGLNGRHPLPDRLALVQAMQRLGADDETQIIAYDNAGGMYAARLWWLMRWLGHGAVAVLDGGIQAWQAQGLPCTTVSPDLPTKGTFSARPARVSTVNYEHVRGNVTTQRQLVVDARAADRYRGENETLDPVGGHIPGAVNHPFKHNLNEQGLFKSPQVLADQFKALMGPRMASDLIMQCGSGVTACHNLLALDVAGLPGASLYPGSWSQWCVQPDTVIATGAEP